MMLSVFCLVIAAVDGDTLKVRCPIWPGIVVEENVRVRGLDTPEIRSRCPGEKALALKARRQASHLSRIELENIDRDKYGRILADVYFEKDGRRMRWADFLIDQGLGRPYAGGKRQPWC